LEVYDAAYLELARRRALPLATLDKDLGTAALPLASTFSGVAREALAQVGKQRLLSSL
jgi:hypothetical protein